MRSQREEARARKRVKLFPETRKHINEVDLDEPQLRPVDVAIHSVLFERDLKQHHGDFAATIHDRVMELALDTPVVLDLARAPTAEEEPVPTITEDPPETAEPTSEVRRRKRLHPDTRQEIADAYVAGMAIDDICRAWSIGIGSLYAVLNTFKIPRRLRYPSKEVALAQLEPLTVSPAVSPVTSVNGTGPGLTEWVVTYTVVRTETVTVAARTFNDAATAATSEFGDDIDVEVLSVAKVRA